MHRHGVGAVLSHVMEVNSERPVAYMSRTLLQVERNYSQIEREALAIVSAVKIFHQYLYGRRFTFVTDHKRLLGLLSELKPIPSMFASRVQRWASLLSSYNYKLLFRRGVLNGNADCMSRLPLPNHSPPSQSKNHVMMMAMSISPIVFENVRLHSLKHPVISKVMDLVMTGEKHTEQFEPRTLNHICVELMSYGDIVLLYHRY